MGRILRIGVDSVTNYTFLATSSYDANNPAATTSAWPDDAAMDQAFNTPSATEVTEEGVLITFQRFPDVFSGAMVKIHPTYDADAGEDPYIEMWIHTTADGWVKRSAIQLRNPFVGVATGARKVFDFTFFPFDRNVDMVWITMNPGATGTPVMRFLGLRLFGYCESAIPSNTNDPGNPCANPSDPFYTGFDDQGNDCVAIPGAPSDLPPTLDLCNPASVAQYRAYISDIPGFLEVFDAWLNNNSEAIALYCAGVEPTPPVPPTPPGLPPPLPALDLCDDTSIEAFRAALAGNPDGLADFDAFLDTLDAAGFFDLACGADDPPEEYVSPNSLEAEPEPDPDAVDKRPFGQGPGGLPDPPARPRESVPPKTPSAPDASPVENQEWLLVADSNDTDFDGGTCSHTGAVTTTQAIIDANTGSALFKDCAQHDAVPLQTFGLTSPTQTCGTGFPFPNTSYVVTNNAVLWSRLRLTFDGGISHAQTLIETELGGGGSVYFTQADYDADVGGNPKVLLDLLGAPDPDTHFPNQATWDDISTLGPLDFNVVDTFIGPDVNGAYGTTPYLAVRITITTQGDRLSNLVMVIT